MKWLAKPIVEEQVDSLANALASASLGMQNDPRLRATLARLLVMRGIDDAPSDERYLSPILADWHSRYQMLGM